MMLGYVQICVYVCVCAFTVCKISSRPSSLPPTTVGRKRLWGKKKKKSNFKYLQYIYIQKINQTTIYYVTRLLI